MGKRQMKKQSGGVFLREGFTTLSALTEVFLIASKVKLLSYGSSGGVLFKFELEEGVESPYTLARSNYPLSPVNTIIMKLVIFRDEKKKTHREDDEEYVPAFVLPVSKEDGKTIESARIFPATRNEFMQEVATQIDIFNKSLDEYLEPICPAILTCIQLLTPKVVQEWFRIFYYNVSSSDKMTKTFFTELLSRPDISELKFGLIFMESLDGYEHLHKITGQDDDEGLILSKEEKLNKYLYESMALYELWRLYNIGYLHGDPHKENFLYNPNYYYIKNHKGRVMMLDFGRTIKIKKEEMPTEENTDDIVKTMELNLGCLDDPEWWSYKWLYDAFHKKRTNYEKVFMAVKIKREFARKAFKIHIEKCGRYNRVSVISSPSKTSETTDALPPVGGRADTGVFNLQSLVQTNPSNIKSTKYMQTNEMTKPPKQLSLSETPASSAEESLLKEFENDSTTTPEQYSAEIYDILDPKYILTSEFIQSEIQSMKNYENNLLNEVTQGAEMALPKLIKIQKGGCNSCMIGGKKSKKRRSIKKQRKSNKSRKNIKN